jgi:hypothetical protein
MMIKSGEGKQEEINFRVPFPFCFSIVNNLGGNEHEERSKSGKWSYMGVISRPLNELPQNEAIYTN